MFVIKNVCDDICEGILSRDTPKCLGAHRVGVEEHGGVRPRHRGGAACVVGRGHVSQLAEVGTRHFKRGMNSHSESMNVLADRLINCFGRSP